MTTMDSAASAAPPADPAVWRIEVHPLDAADDPVGRNVLHEAREMGLAGDLREVRAARVYLIETTLDQATIERVAAELLADPVTQRFVIGAAPVPDDAALVEVHYLPGVMDPVAGSTQYALVEMLGAAAEPAEVRTGWRYELFGVDRDHARRLADRLLANTVVQQVAAEPHHPDRFLRGTPYELQLTAVPIRELDDAALQRLSREGHLFLSLEEMRAIRDYYRAADREPTDIELETLAQTWSEHCVHKTLKSTVRYRQAAGDAGGRGALPDVDQFADRPGHRVEDDGTLVIDNLLRSTIAAATGHLMDHGVDWCVSVFVDNAGIIRFDDADAVTFKVETHNHPSAIEPYGGAATGIGGCIRDTMGTGLAAKPIANTDVFCVAFPDRWAVGEEGQGPGAEGRGEGGADADAPSASSLGPRPLALGPAAHGPLALGPAALPQGVLHPRRILKQVVAGVRDYGNRMGIPTVNGAVYFDDRYLGNPLVFAGSVGLIPNDRCFGDPQAGDRIIVLGGRTGRDGIHGATFSSAELTDTHADEFSHAVQIGNPITEKKMLDVILRARDHADGCLFHAITDCGAGGFSSAVGEMGEKLGAEVHLERAPLKYQGLSYTEIWISEAQERMVLAVPPEKLDALAALCDAEDVEWCDLGHFGTDDAQLILHYAGTEVGRLGMEFLHEGIPQPVREASWQPRTAQPQAPPPSAAEPADLETTLLRLLGHPNLASKHWIIRQYDHEVQGGSIVKPLVGPGHDGPGDAAVLRPKLDSVQGLAISCGLATGFGDVDPYWMTLAAIDEAVRNAVCVGARADRIAILDNFCWPSCEQPGHLGSLVRAAEACYDGALAYRTPFISGKDSLNNQFTTEAGQTIAIPPTLLISAMGIVDDITRCVTMDAKGAGHLLLCIGATTGDLAGSHLALLHGGVPPAAGHPTLPRVDLERGPRVAAAVARLIAEGLVRAAHDCSEGGLLPAAAEMAFAGRRGLELDLSALPRDGELSALALCFAETPSRILIEIDPEQYDRVLAVLKESELPFGEIGTFTDDDRLTARTESEGQLLDVKLDALRAAWRKPLDW